jgi:hypothetical protein
MASAIRLIATPQREASMIRRIALLAGALAACSDVTGASYEAFGQRNLGDDDTAFPPPDLCTDDGSDRDGLIVPWCVDLPQWPDDLARQRHGFETARVRRGAF